MQIQPCVPSAGRRLMSQEISIKSNKAKLWSRSLVHVKNQSLQSTWLRLQLRDPHSLKCVLHAKTMGNATGTLPQGTALWKSGALIRPPFPAHRQMNFNQGALMGDADGDSCSYTTGRRRAPDAAQRTPHRDPRAGSGARRGSCGVLGPLCPPYPHRGHESQQSPTPGSKRKRSASKQ